MAVHRAHSAEEHVIAAQGLLAAHQLDPETGRCVDCRDFAPCDRANEAFSRLQRYGVVPVRDTDEPSSSYR